LPVVFKSLTMTVLHTRFSHSVTRNNSYIYFHLEETNAMWFIRI